MVYPHCNHFKIFTTIKNIIEKHKKILNIYNDDKYFSNYLFMRRENRSIYKYVCLWAYKTKMDNSYISK